MDGTFTTASAGTVDYDDGESIDLTSAGTRYITGFTFGKFGRDIRPIASPGEDGQGTKDFGEREQYFTVEVTYIESDEATVLAAIADDLIVLGNVCSFDTVPYEACILEDSKFEQTRTASLDGGKTVYCKGKLTFKSVRPSE